MEQSLSSLAYKGSISEAINEAKKQRKLFVVYISGQDSESSRLENSTWTDVNVGEAVSKYCILLDIPEESTDASNFSAIYPQKSVPCITAIGFNGVLLWQNEGFVSADVLVSSLEKVWLSLQIQETTATVLSAALASQNSDPATTVMPTASTDGSSSSTPVLADQGSSSSTVTSLPLTEENGQLQDSMHIMMNETKGRDCKFEDKNKDLRDKTSSIPVDANGLESIGEEQSTCGSSTEACHGSQDVAIIERDSKGTSSITEGGSPRGITVNQPILIGGSQGSGVGEFDGLQIGNSEAEEDERVDAFEHCARLPKSSDARYPGELPVKQSGDLGGNSEAFVIEDNEAAQVVKGEVEDIKKVIKSSDAYLNIRLPDGTSLQEMFSVTSTLRNVKEFIDEHQGSGIGSYDLAIPYPRKVFTVQDLGKPLSELDLYGRQALIVVPYQKGTGYLRGNSSIEEQIESRYVADAQNGSNGSYFSIVKIVLSFINPFSYLGSGGASSSSSEEQSQNGMWQYSPSSTLRNNPTQSASESGRSEGSRKRPSASRFGSNIHTLRHDEDERFSDRNKFWNGNSTQYGGNDDRK